MIPDTQKALVWARMTRGDRVIHPRRGSVGKNPILHHAVGGPKRPKIMDLQIEPRVLSQNTSMMSSYIPTTIREVPMIPTIPNKTSKYLFKPEIYPDRYLHMYLAHLAVSQGRVILAPKRPKMAKNTIFPIFLCQLGEARVLKMIPFRCSIQP